MRGQSLRRRATLAGGALISAMLLSPLPAIAHHGWGGNESKTSEISGVVESPVSLAGPHATMKVNADGQVWDITLAPPARTSAAGLKEGMIPVGSKVVLHGNRSSDAKRFEMKVTRLTWNGKVYNVYPDQP